MTMEIILDLGPVRVVEIGQVAHVQEKVLTHWRTIREFVPQFDTTTWTHAQQYAHDIMQGKLL